MPFPLFLNFFKWVLFLLFNCITLIVHTFCIQVVCHFLIIIIQYIFPLYISIETPSFKGKQSLADNYGGRQDKLLLHRN